MRVIDQFTFPKNTNAKFPFGSTILNETDINDGTPIVEEIYGDVLMNIYKILQMVGITPSGDQDNNLTQFQIVEAIQKLPNVINDVEHSLILSGTEWSVALNFEFLPNKFVFFARAAENFDPSTSYTITGNDDAFDSNYPVICPDGFSANDEVMVVLDTSTVRIYPLNTSSSVSGNFVPMALGTPLPYNNGKFLYYLENGNLLNESPSFYSIENTLKVFASDSSVIILQAFILKGKLLCFTTRSDNSYRFYQFDLLDFNSPELVDYDIPDGVDYVPYCYTDGTSIFITNDANTSADDFVLRKLNYDQTVPEMTDGSTITLENTFYKTTNAVMKPNDIITLVSGNLTAFSLADETKTDLGTYDKAIGNLFSFKNSFYFGIDEVASKWIL
jgi:hypothetical protein